MSRKRIAQLALMAVRLGLVAIIAAAAPQGAALADDAQPSAPSSSSVHRAKNHTLHYDEKTGKWIVLPEDAQGNPIEPRADTGPGDQPTTFGQVGFGVSAGVFNGQVQISPLVFSVDYANIPKVLGPGESGGGLFNRVYGHTGGAFDINSEEAGAIFHNRLGYNILQPSEHRAVSPVLGVEPVNLDVGGASEPHTPDPNQPQNPTGARTQYFYVSSMLAGGVELMNDSCKAIIAAKGGGITGPGGDGQLVDPAAGLEATAVCQGFYANVDATWLPMLDKNAGQAILTGSVARNLGTTSNGSLWSIGAVVDARTSGKDGVGYSPSTLFSTDQTEVRAQLTVNVNWAH